MLTPLTQRDSARFQPHESQFRVQIPTSGLMFKAKNVLKFLKIKRVNESEIQPDVGIRTLNCDSFGWKRADSLCSAARAENVQQTCTAWVSLRCCLCTKSDMKQVAASWPLDFHTAPSHTSSHIFLKLGLRSSGQLSISSLTSCEAIAKRYP